MDPMHGGHRPKPLISSMVQLPEQRPEVEIIHRTFPSFGSYLYSGEPTLSSACFQVISGARSLQAHYCAHNKKIHRYPPGLC